MIEQNHGRLRTRSAALSSTVRRPALKVAVLAIVAIGAATVAATPGSASTASSPVVGHVYVNDNTAGVNTIAAFDRHADGSLTPVSGSPFAAGGAGAGMTVGSQGAIQIADQGRYLIAVDPGSNQISVLRIKADGSLQRVDTVGSGGSQPVSIAVHGELVYVANAGTSESNYTGFTLNAGGKLKPLAGSTVSLPDGSQPGDVLFSGDGRTLVGTRVATSLIDSFAVSANGHLTPAADSPFAAQGLGPFGSEFRPTNPSQLFVSNAHGGAGNGNISAYEIAGDATLSSINGSPFADQQTAPCWVEISHDGKYLFTDNTLSNNVSRFSITPDGTLTLLGSTPIGGAANGPFDARLSPDGTTLWTVDDPSNSISGFAVSAGTLTELPSSPTPLPAGAHAFGIVVD